MDESSHSHRVSTCNCRRGHGGCAGRQKTAPNAYRRSAGPHSDHSCGSYISPSRRVGVHPTWAIVTWTIVCADVEMPDVVLFACKPDLSSSDVASLIHGLLHPYLGPCLSVLCWACPFLHPVFPSVSFLLHSAFPLDILPAHAPRLAHAPRGTNVHRIINVLMDLLGLYKVDDIHSNLAIGQVDVFFDFPSAHEASILVALRT